MQHDFTDLELNKGLVKGKLPDADLVEVEMLLELSAGTKTDGTKTYRPYAVCALLYEAKALTRERGEVVRVEEIEFAELDDAQGLLAFWLGFQARIDKMLGLTVPDAYGVQEAFKSPPPGFVLLS